MSFTEIAEVLKPLGDAAVAFVSILSAFGLSAVLLASLKLAAERRRWRRFKDEVERWTDDILESESRRKYNDDDLKIECERMLTVAGFGPLEIEKLIDVSLNVAKGFFAAKLLIV